MGFDFNKIEDTISNGLLDSWNKGIDVQLSNIVDQINKEMYESYVMKFRGSIKYATLCKDPEGNTYIDCYKSNWDRLKTHLIYDIFWDIVKANWDICKQVKWKLNPFLMDVRIHLFESSIFIKECNISQDNKKANIRLDIPFIKEFMEFTYGENAYCNRTTYLHSIIISEYVSPEISLINSYEELNEFILWINNKLKQPKNSSSWIINNTNFVLDAQHGTHNFMSLIRENKEVYFSKKEREYNSLKN